MASDVKKVGTQYLGELIYKMVKSTNGYAARKTIINCVRKRYEIYKTSS